MEDKNLTKRGPTILVSAYSKVKVLVKKGMYCSYMTAGYSLLFGVQQENLLVLLM